MTEDEFLKKLKQGDNEAYSHLTELYQKKLYYFCLKILKNSFDAGDAVQITFIKINTAIGSFEEKSKLSSWIYKIALNTCNDILRQKKKSHLLLSDSEKTAFFLSQSEKSPEEALLLSELGQVMYSEIGKLPQIQKSLVILRDIHGFSYKEIGKMLSLKEGTVKSGLNRARKKLRKNLEKYLK